MELRPYQSRAVSSVETALASGARTCLVAPTGSGKTVMGAAVASRYSNPLWLVHRRELLEQAPVRAMTIQGLLGSGARYDADLLVLDECHHYRADQWGDVAEHYRGTPTLGLTATPERSDGRPLGDLFERLIVAASYSELLADGHLVPCDTWAPPEQAPGVAMPPYDAYQRFGERGQAFVFHASVAAARACCEAWPWSEVVTGDVPTSERDDIMCRFRSGELRALHTVDVLTEGVDVPAASVCVLARPMHHVSQYMQAAGRVLRPYPHKERAILIDLCGSALLHGSPTEDRIYSLDGQAIRRQTLPSIHQCLRCGYVWEAASRTCPQCGYEPSVTERPRPKVYSMELALLPSLDAATAQQRRRELRRLIDLCAERDWSLTWAGKEYAKLFPDERPGVMHRATTLDERRAEHQRMMRRSKELGHKQGWAAHRYKALFGVWPR